MKEKALVISNYNRRAKVRILSPGICQKCQAQDICIGRKLPDGSIIVHNPLGAKPGDEVEIKVPETEYNKQMIKFFGILLIGFLAGTGIGYLISSIISISQTAASLVGGGIGLLISVVKITISSRTRKLDYLYPTITQVIKKGENYG
ncbi:MAG: SoxR reducing system RseC family protein [Candidatus Aminicenantia bacterium]